MTDLIGFQHPNDRYKPFYITFGANRSSVTDVLTAISKCLKPDIFDIAVQATDSDADLRRAYGPGLYIIKLSADGYEVAITMLAGDEQIDYKSMVGWLIEQWARMRYLHHK